MIITSFPVSSQSIAKSKSTSLVRWTKIEGATTLRCTPRKNRKMMNTVERLKNGWFISDAKNGTSAVWGSPSHHKAPQAETKWRKKIGYIFTIASIVYASSHSVEINLLSLIFGKNFVKLTFLLKKSLNSWFDEIFFGESKFPLVPLHSVRSPK